MKKYTKTEAIAIITSCALAYQKHLVDRSLLFLCLDNHRNAFTTEVTFDASNFLHLTGLKPCAASGKNETAYRLSPLAFYNRCLTHTHMIFLLQRTGQPIKSSAFCRLF